MSKSKAFIVAALALGVTSGVERQQQPAAPPQLPQAPNMTFFVTGAGPGKGADLGGIEGADQHCQTLARATARAARPGAPISAPRRPPASRPSTRATASATARGRTSRARSSRPASTTCTATTTSSASTTRCRERGLIIPGVGFAPNRHDVLTGSTTEGRAFPAGEDRTCKQLDEQHPGRRHGRPYRPQGLARRRGVEVVERIASLARARWRLQPERSARHRRRRAVLLLRHPVRDVCKHAIGGRAGRSGPSLLRRPENSGGELVLGFEIQLDLHVVGVAEENLPAGAVGHLVDPVRHALAGEVLASCPRSRGCRTRHGR